MNTITSKSLLESQILQRQLILWGEISKHYDVEPHLNHKVHQWIANGTLAEHSLKIKLHKKKTGKL